MSVYLCLLMCLFPPVTGFCIESEIIVFFIFCMILIFVQLSLHDSDDVPTDLLKSSSSVALNKSTKVFGSKLMSAYTFFLFSYLLGQ